MFDFYIVEMAVSKYQKYISHLKCEIVFYRISWPIRSHWTLSLLPENVRKPNAFLMFSGVEKGCIGDKWVKSEIDELIKLTGNSCYGVCSQQSWKPTTIIFMVSDLDALFWNR